jgi:hypothetical protein
MNFQSRSIGFKLGEYDGTTTSFYRSSVHRGEDPYRSLNYGKIPLPHQSR